MDTFASLPIYYLCVLFCVVALIPRFAHAVSENTPIEDLLDIFR